MTTQGLQVLVVDDNGMNRKLMSMLLTKMGAVPMEAGSGMEWVKMADEKKYDMILMDYMMPEMDGAETLQRIRELQSSLNKDTPIIALTADDSGNGEAYYIQQGFDGYLLKPVLPQKLKELVENL